MLALAHHQSFSPFSGVGTPPFSVVPPQGEGEWLLSASQFQPKGFIIFLMCLQRNERVPPRFIIIEYPVKLMDIVLKC